MGRIQKPYIAIPIYKVYRRGCTGGSERCHDVDIVHVRRIQLPGLFARILFQCRCDVTVSSSFVFQVKGVISSSYSVFEASMRDNVALRQP